MEDRKLNICFSPKVSPKLPRTWGIPFLGQAAPPAWAAADWQCCQQLWCPITALEGQTMTEVEYGLWRFTHFSPSTQAWPRHKVGCKSSSAIHLQTSHLLSRFKAQNCSSALTWTFPFLCSSYGISHTVTAVATSHEIGEAHTCSGTGVL